MAEEEILLNNDYSQRRASLIIAYGLNLLINANKSQGDPKEKSLLKLLEKLIIEKNDCSESEKKHLKEMQHLIYSSQAGPKDPYFKKLYDKLLTTKLGEFDTDFSKVEDLILDLVSEMIVRDMLRIKPGLEKCFVDELKACSSDISKLVLQAQNIGLKPVKEMPSCLKEQMVVFRPNILYAGRQGRLSVGSVDLKERSVDGLIYCEIDFSIEGIVQEKQRGILSRSPDNNFVLLTQATKESNKAFHNSQTLWQIGYDFDHVKSGNFRTISFNPSYFDQEWFILGSCQQSLDMIGTQCSVHELPESLHIAASRYIDIDHLVTRDNSNESVMELLKKIFSKEVVKE